MSERIFTRKPRKPVTAEAQKNMSLGKIGNKNALGKHWELSEETKKKMSLSRLGKSMSEEAKKKLSDYWSGKPSNGALENYIKKFGPWNKGKKCPQLAGANNSLWKGGITLEVRKIRTSLEYKLWQDSCLSRDGYVCQKYGTVGGKLNVHHVLNFSSYPELRFAIDNGVTLSEKAHKEFHRKYGIKNNTREQLEEFLKQ